MKKILLFCFILVCLTSCNRYFTPETYANPKQKFERRIKKIERKMRISERRNNPTIDPLRWHH